MPILTLGILGIAFGLLLSFASKKFYVAPDTRVEDVLNLLPGVNCGACGFPGCSGLAAAIIEEGESPNRCKPIKADKKQEIIDYYNSLKTEN